MKVKIIFHLFLVSFIPLYAIAQNDSANVHRKIFFKSLSLSATYQNGYIFGTNNFLRGKNIESEKINAYQAFSIKLTTQTTGDKLWEQLYKYPNWGMGVYVADFYNPVEIGVPIAVYGFFNAPVKRWNKLSFNYEFGFGAAFNWKSYNPITNQYNVAIGAGGSFLIDAGLNLQYSLIKKLDIVAGFNFSHFSNGALKEPNYGINTIAPKISIKYNFYDNVKFQRHVIPDYLAENEWIVSAFAGVKNVIFDSVNIDLIEKYEGVYFPMFGISTTYNRQITYKSKIGIGMSVSYNGSVNAQIAIDNNELVPVNGPLDDKIQLSVYPSYELVVHKISLILQPAFYLYRKKLKSQSPVFHQRIGLKYHLTDHFFIGITLRDYSFHISDFIEWNIGYRIKGR